VNYHMDSIWMCLTCIRRIHVTMEYNLEQRLRFLIKHQQTRIKNKYTNNGIYQLQCPCCNKTYAGQTGRALYQRYKEHFRDFKTGNFVSNFVNHLLDNNHTMGPTQSPRTVQKNSTFLLTFWHRSFTFKC
jgi:hypothetical protein